MPKMHLKQLALLDKRGITYSVCGPFTKNNERIQKLMQAENTNVIYKNDLDKDCFQHDMTSSAAGMRSMPNQQLANELHEPIIRKIFKKEFIFHLKTIFGVQI